MYVEYFCVAAAAICHGFFLGCSVLSHNIPIVLYLFSQVSCKAQNSPSVTLCDRKKDPVFAQVTQKPGFFQWRGIELRLWIQQRSSQHIDGQAGHLVGRDQKALPVPVEGHGHKAANCKGKRDPLYLGRGGLQLFG